MSVVTTAAVTGCAKARGARATAPSTGIFLEPGRLGAFLRASTPASEQHCSRWLRAASCRAPPKNRAPHCTNACVLLVDSTTLSYSSSLPQPHPRREEGEDTTPAGVEACVCTDLAAAAAAAAPTLSFRQSPRHHRALGVLVEGEARELDSSCSSRCVCAFVVCSSSSEREGGGGFSADLSESRSTSSPQTLSCQERFIPSRACPIAERDGMRRLSVAGWCTHVGLVLLHTSFRLSSPPLSIAPASM